MYFIGSLLTLLALLLIVVPMLKHRGERWVTPGLCTLIVLFPLAVAAIYMNVSSFDWDSSATPVPEQQMAAPVDAMMTELAARMRREPDLEGWMLLGRSYTSIGRFAEAADAWNEAWRMTEGQDPEVALSYAEALVRADQRTLKTSAADLLEDVLIVMPDDSRALWYGGLSAAALGHNELATERLTRLLQSELPDNMRMVVQQQLAALSLDPEAMATLQAKTDAAVTTITVRISITPELARQANENDLLFLIARNLDQPMPPVAVKRVRVGDFPVSLKISDHDVMIPGKRLKDVVNLELIARISKSNQAFAAAGDLYGDTLPSNTADGNLEAEILINKVVDQD